MRRSLVKLSGVVNDVTKMVTVCLRATKVTMFGMIRLKGFLVKYEILSVYFWKFIKYPGLPYYWQYLTTGLKIVQ